MNRLTGETLLAFSTVVLMEQRKPARFPCEFTHVTPAGSGLSYFPRRMTCLFSRRLKRGSTAGADTLLVVCCAYCRKVMACLLRGVSVVAVGLIVQQRKCTSSAGIGYCVGDGGLVYFLRKLPSIQGLPRLECTTGCINYTPPPHPTKGMIDHR